MFLYKKERKKERKEGRKEEKKKKNRSTYLIVSATVMKVTHDCYYFVDFCFPFITIITKV